MCDHTQIKSFQKRGKKLKYKCKIERLKYNPYIELIIKNNDQTETLMSTWNGKKSKISNRASYESLLKENRIIGLRIGSTFLNSNWWITLAHKRTENEPGKRGREKSLNSTVTCVGMSTLSIRSFQHIHRIYLRSTSTPLLILVVLPPPSG